MSRPAGELPAQLADKHALSTICAHLGVAHPETTVVAGRADLERAERDYGYPLLAKWAKPWLLPPDRKLRSTTLVHSPAQLRSIGLEAGQQASELLLQKYIPPAPDADWFFHGYFRGDSTCAFSGTGRKERAYPRSAGITTLGRWVDNPQIDHVARTLAKSLHYSGILDMDFRYHAEDGHYYLLDFNPRVGAQFRLFHDSSALDVVRAAYLDLTGDAREAGDPAYERVYVVENYDLLRKLTRKSGSSGRSGRGWISSLRAADELAWFARDDPDPFTQMIRQTFTRALRRRRRPTSRP
ncbi:MAG: ATP-grasp domain-containing protein [Nonomuraea sp.]|nr:ATP-grasp domain-containing protein [Nonomuraea sp.]